MPNDKIPFNVKWDREARLSLADMVKYKVDSKRVFRQSKLLLSENPRKNSWGTADYPGFEFNGYDWIKIGNAICVYEILEEQNLVLVDACFYASTGWALKVFFGENDPYDEYDSN
ncbi:hypothetical protein [Halalkalibacter nanhaiisediminis]|uniref:Uncharacterized protein n=1 Tax=Halalkalibacter nanhaiisediminis TaxID=688079 RepID=A0A562QHW6_9BACI|nr:hypothetical protein [Halalkalibacter nanhaiisediminis]TWI56342.1 hypothetical protein IQ10_02236 [Halalkalibacter nanhaiisediminis]